MVTSSSPLDERPGRVVAVFGLACAYFITGWLGFLVAMPPGNATALWPPSGIALLALLVGGRRLWPGVFLGAFVTNLVMFPGSGGLLAIVGPAAIGAGSTVEIVLAATLIERFAGGRDVLAAPGRVPRFVAACAAAAAVAATVGLLVTTGIAGAEVHVVDFWLTWWLGDVVGMLVIAPLAFVATRRPARPLEWVGTLIVTLVVCELLFGRPFFTGGTDLPLSWAIVPAVVWAAVRLDVRAVVFLTLLIHVMASWGTVDDVGHLARYGDEGLLVLDGLLVVAILTGLLLAATGEVIENARQTLEDRVAERTRDLELEHEERVRLQRLLVEAGRQEAIGRLAGGVAHDFNNLLTVIRAEAESLRGVDDSRDAATTILEAGDRAAGLTRQLLALAVAPGPERTVDVGMAVRTLKRLLRPVLPQAIELVVVDDGEARLARIDQGLLDQVLLNLTLNARDAIMRGGGRGTLTLTLRDVPDATALDPSRRPKAAGPFVVIDVKDSGPGIDAALLERIFEPGFTTRPGEGHGLGLPTAAAILARAGGALSVQSASGRGSTFSVWVPALVSTASSAPLHPLA